MKKCITLVTVFVLLFTLTSCTGDTDPRTSYYRFAGLYNGAPLFYDAWNHDEDITLYTLEDNKLNEFQQLEGRTLGFLRDNLAITYTWGIDDTFYLNDLETEEHSIITIYGGYERKSVIYMNEEYILFQGYNYGADYKRIFVYDIEEGKNITSFDVFASSGSDNIIVDIEDDTIYLSYNHYSDRVEYRSYLLHINSGQVEDSDYILGGNIIHYRDGMFRYVFSLPGAGGFNGFSQTPAHPLEELFSVYEMRQMHFMNNQFYFVNHFDKQIAVYDAGGNPINDIKGPLFSQGIGMIDESRYYIIESKELGAFNIRTEYRITIYDIYTEELLQQTSWFHGGSQMDYWRKNGFR